MSTHTIQPTDWHRRPPGCPCRKRCPVCGGSSAVWGEHRATLPDEGYKHRFLVRKKGWRRYVVRERGPLWTQKGIPRPRTSTGPTARIVRMLGKAAALLAHGKDLAQTAHELGTTVARLVDRRDHYPELWQAAMDRAAEQVVQIVRAVAGTPHVLDRPLEEYLAMASVAERWTQGRGEELFPANGKMTLLDFYKDYYVPKVMATDVTEGYLQQFDVALRKWQFLTGNPALKDITIDTLARFRDALLNGRGLKPGTKVSPCTVAGKMHSIQRLLDKSGPAGRGNRDGAGILEQVPYVKAPRTFLRAVRVIDINVVGDVYRAAGRMDTPAIPGINPGAWWQALIVLVYNTGIRRRTLFELEWVDVDWQAHCLNIPPERLKSRREEVIHLNATALEHLERIRGDRQLVFPWPHCPEYFTARWHYVLDLVGIPRRDHFTLKHLRKTLGTSLYGVSPGAAQLVLGHADTRITERHYVQREGVVAEALDRLPQPDAFRDNGG